MWFIGVEVQQETSAPPPIKNPGSAPVIGSYNRPEGNQSIDRHEGNPHLPTALLVLPFVISLNVIFHFFFININSAAYLVCCLNYQDNFGLCEHIGT